MRLFDIWSIFGRYLVVICGCFLTFNGRFPRNFHWFSCPYSVRLSWKNTACLIAINGICNRNRMMELSHSWEQRREGLKNREINKAVPNSSKWRTTLKQFKVGSHESNYLETLAFLIEIVLTDHRDENSSCLAWFLCHRNKAEPKFKVTELLQPKYLLGCQFQPHEIQNINDI